MKPNRPLIIHTEVSRGWGGQEIRVLAELSGMTRFGYKTLLMAPRESAIFKNAISMGLEVYPVSFEAKTEVGSFVKLLAAIGKLRPAVLNTHSSDDSCLAGLAARLLKVPLIIRTRHVSTPIGSSFSYRCFPHAILFTSGAIRSHLNNSA